MSPTTSNVAPPLSPRSPTPLLDLSPSKNTDIEGLNGQARTGEEGKFDQLRRALGYKRKYGDSKITFSTKVPHDIRSISGYDPGYPRLAAFENCDPNFLIYRRFGWLHNRVLLNLQDELSQLERDLEREDHWEHQDGDAVKLKSRRKDCKRPSSKRQEMLRTINAKLKEYDELLFRLRDVQALKRPSGRNQGNLYQAVKTNIVDAENLWILRSNDLAALAHDAEHGSFNVWLEWLLNKVSRTILLVVCRTREQQKVTGSMPHLNLVDPTRFNILLKALLTLLASLLFLAPVCTLWYLQPTDPSKVRSSGWHQIFVVFGFTLTFSACCALFTKARKQELFTATAAYSAVLVVFLGNTSQMLAYSNTGSSASS